MRTCTCCKARFVPERPKARVCSELCALTIARATVSKLRRTAMVQDKRETKVKLDRLKSKAQWAKETQQAFNRWIRLRDADQPCISCGRHHQGQWHAGHFLSTGARPELRFHPWNVNKQCAPCNTYLSGNAVLYRQRLIEKIGLEAVEWLEGPHPLRNDSIDDLKDMKKVFTIAAKKLTERMT